MVDGDLTNEIHYKVGAGERFDFYVDLTKKNGSAVSADQFKLIALYEDALAHRN